MTTFRRANQRQHDRRGRQEVWFTFGGHENGKPPGRWLRGSRKPQRGTPRPRIRRPDPTAARCRDRHLRPRGRPGIRRRQRNLGHHPGWRVRVHDRQPRHFSRRNHASRGDWVCYSQIGLRPAHAEPAPACEQKRFGTAERRGALRVVASPDARNGSLRTHRDVSIWSALLDPAQHLVHELAADRRAWLHLVRGEVTLGDVVMTTGDGAGVADERVISLTARGKRNPADRRRRPRASLSRDDPRRTSK